MAAGKLSFIRELTEELVADECALAAIAARVDSANAHKWLPALIRLCSKRGEAVKVVTAIVSTEMKIAPNPSALTASTKAATAFFVIHGFEYLERVLAPHLQKIIQTGTELEIDETRLQRGQEIGKSRQVFSSVVSDLVAAITQSASFAPPAFRQLCHSLSAVLTPKFGPAAGSAVLREALLLRYFVGAIMNPVDFGLMKTTPTPAAQRALTIVAKGLANMAKQTTFAGGWAFMSAVEPLFLTTFQPLVTDYLNKLSAGPEQKEQPLDRDAGGVSKVQLQMEQIEFGIANLFLVQGMPDAKSPHICGDSNDSDVLGKGLNDIKAKLVDSASGSSVPHVKRVEFLLKCWAEAKAKGTSAEAMMQATREFDQVRDLDPESQRLEALAAGISKRLKEIAQLTWLDADDVGGVKIAIMEAGIEGISSEHINVKGSVRIEKTCEQAIEMLHSLSQRQKWDRMCNQGVTELKKISPHTRIVLLEASDPSAHYIVLEHYNPPPTPGTGGVLAFASHPGVTLPFAVKTAGLGDFATSGFVVQPITDSATPASRVSYVLNVKFGGNVGIEDAWGAAMEIVQNLRQFAGK